MAVVFPLAMPTTLFADVTWRLQTGARGNASGFRNAISGVRVTDPFFTARYETPFLGLGDVRRWEAFIEALDGPMGTFFGVPWHRSMPAAHPSGLAGFNGIAALTAWASDGDMQITGCPTGFTITAGDLVGLVHGGNRTVVRALQDSVSGATRKIAVAGLVNAAVFPSGTQVRFHEPTAVFRLKASEIALNLRRAQVILEAEQVLA